MTTAVLSLGSNIGDSAATLATAVDALGDSVRAVSSIYRTPPWGGVDQDDFLNAVVIADDGRVTDPHDWLQRCHELELAAGRVREIHWGPRTLDVDVVTVTTQADRPVLVDDDQLTLPHPLAAERAFVLVPWAEIDPDAELPGWGAIAGLIDQLDRSAIIRIGPLRDGRRGARR